MPAYNPAAMAAAEAAYLAAEDAFFAEWNAIREELGLEAYVYLPPEGLSAEHEARLRPHHEAVVATREAIRRLAGGEQ